MSLSDAMWQRARLRDDALGESPFIFPQPPLVWILCQLFVFVESLGAEWLVVMTNCQRKGSPQALVMRPRALELLDEYREEIDEADVLVLEAWPKEANA